MNSIDRIPREVRRRLKRISQHNSDGNYRRRAMALLLLHKGNSVSQVAKVLQASRTSIYAWRERYQQYGEGGLIPERRGRREETVTEGLCAELLKLIQRQPGDYGYLRSRWTSEMLAHQLCAALSVAIHSSTVRRVLPKLGVVWNRARPTLCIKDPKKADRMKAIEKALASADKHNPVFYVDEVDIDLNPRIGHGWMKKGQQTAVPTPGKNEKRYLAGALNATTGNVLWAEWERKNSEIFILLLAELKKRYRHAKRIRLIADNYIIHKSAMTRCFLQNHPKFELLFQPVYHPWVNRIELLWKQLHDTVTRNHRYSTMNQLMESVRQFMSVASPFPGSGASLAKAPGVQDLGSAI